MDCLDVPYVSRTNQHVTSHWLGNPFYADVMATEIRVELILRVCYMCPIKNLFDKSSESTNIQLAYKRKEVHTPVEAHKWDNWACKTHLIWCSRDMASLRSIFRLGTTLRRFL